MERLVAIYLFFKNLISVLVDRPSERSPLQTFNSPREVWDYIRRFVPYTGDPGLPWLEATTTGARDRYTHPERVMHWAERNRQMIQSGFQACWPYHVNIDCDDVALFACELLKKMGHDAWVTTLTGKPLKQSHVVCLFFTKGPEKQLCSIDTSGIVPHDSMASAITYFEKTFGASYQPHQTPLPFGLKP